METLMLLSQVGSLLSSVAALVLVLGALPYAIGRAVGRRAERRALLELSVEDKPKFQLWLASGQIKTIKSMNAALAGGSGGRHSDPRAVWGWPESGRRRRGFWR